MTSIAYQTWQDVIFLHWKADPALLLSHIPKHPACKLDTFNGEARISLVGFKVHHSRLKYLPPIPGLAEFSELNLRTYVTFNGKKGLVFLHIDASSTIVASVYKLTGLPYHSADLSSKANSFEYTGRKNLSENKMLVNWEMSAVPSPKTEADIWLTERYANYKQGPEGSIYEYPVKHKEWPLKSVTLTTSILSYKWKNIKLEADKIQEVHFSKGVDAEFYPRLLHH